MIYNCWIWFASVKYLIIELQINIDEEIKEWNMFKIYLFRLITTFNLSRLP